jgi:hypothetical protein
VWLTDQPEKILGKLGPEPLEKNFTAQWLFENLHKRKRSLKPLLLDQSFIAVAIFTPMNVYTSRNCIHWRRPIMSHKNKPKHCTRQFAQF